MTDRDRDPKPDDVQPAPRRVPRGPRCPRYGRHGGGKTYSVNGIRQTKPRSDCHCQRRHRSDALAEADALAKDGP